MIDFLERLLAAQRRAEDGRERALALKKAWSTRLMSAFAGACSGRSGPSPQRSGPRK